MSKYLSSIQTCRVSNTVTKSRYRNFLCCKAAKLDHILLDHVLDDPVIHFNPANQTFNIDASFMLNLVVRC